MRQPPNGSSNVEVGAGQWYPSVVGVSAETPSYNLKEMVKGLAHGTLNRSNQKSDAVKVQDTSLGRLDTRRLQSPRLIYERSTQKLSMHINRQVRWEKLGGSVYSLQYLVAFLLPLLQVALGQISPILVQLFRRQSIYLTFFFRL